MKIDEACINHNVILALDENILPWEMSEQDDNTDHQRLITLGYTRGVLDLARMLKEVLKA